MAENYGASSSTSSLPNLLIAGPFKTKTVTLLGDATNAYTEGCIVEHVIASNKWAHYDSTQAALRDQLGIVTQTRALADTTSDFTNASVYVQGEFSEVVVELACPQTGTYYGNLSAADKRVAQEKLADYGIVLSDTVQVS